MSNLPRSGPESHGAGPANRSSNSSRSSIRCDQECYRWSRVPYSSGDGKYGINDKDELCIPPPRSGAASVVLNDKLYVFGGFGGGAGRLDDFYSFDFATSSWEEIKPAGDEKPGCRENNGVVISSSSRTIILFGGYNGRRWLNDLWSFDITTKRWTCIQESSDSRRADSIHETSAGLGRPTAADGSLSGNDAIANMALTAGGHNSTQSRRSISGKRPCCRFGYVSVTHNNKFIVWGGFEGSDWLNDMYIFDFESLTWSEIQQHGTLPSRRSCPAWAKDEKFIYLHGGYDGNERKDE